MQITFLTNEIESEYQNFILNNPNSLLYASLKYRRLLKELLQAEDFYFVSLDEHKRINGVLPTFLKRSEKIGNVLNSLPFFGSNGAITTSDNRGIKKELLNAFYGFADKQKCISTTIITPPLEKDNDFYFQNACATFVDERIGLLTTLPDNDSNLDSVLMQKLNPKVRYEIRKAKKNGIIISSEYLKGNQEFLMKTYFDNMGEIGGETRPEGFFASFPKIFEYGKDYEIFTALLNGTPISSLLVFYFNRTVEYTIPTIEREFRTLQPLSLIIFEAMKKAITKGHKWWNWGGTWLGMNGVYKFKKRWSDKETRYYYFTRIYNHSILRLAPQEILREFPFFFVVPFSKLRA